MTNNEAQREQRAAWLPAVLLIIVQLVSGMRDQPQLAFFVIYLREQLRLEAGAISSVAAGAQVAGMVMALLGGGITRRLGSKWVLVIGLALSAVGSLAFQAHTPALVIPLWLTSGMGLALTTVGGSSYLTRISARGSLGILAAFFAMSLTAGGAIGNPLAGVVIERYGFTTYSWMIISISAGAILFVSLLMSNMRDTPGSGADGRKPGIFTAARLPAARYLIGLRSLATIHYGMLLVLIPLLLNELSGSKVLVATYGTTNLVVASAAQLLAGRLADRWGARGPSLAAFGLMILSGLGLAATYNTVWGLFGFGVLGISAAWALATLMYVWVSDGVAKPDQPATFGMLHAVWSVSMITGSMLGGWFVQTLPALPFLIAGLINAGSLFLIAAYYPRGGKQPERVH